MGEAERQVQGLALNCRAVAHAHEFKLALEALGDALDHIGEVRTRAASLGCLGGSSFGQLDVDGLVGLLHQHAFGEGEREGALGTLDRHAAGIDRNGHALGQVDGLLGYAGHDLLFPAGIS